LRLAWLLSDGELVTERPLAPHRVSRRVLLFGLLGCAVLAAGLSIRFLLFASASTPTDMAPGERELRNAPFITSPDRVVDEMVKLAALTEDDLVYDLGCGDGRIVVTAALQSGCRGVGYDIDPQRVEEATRNAKEHGVEERVAIVEQDVFTIDLSQADVCLMYLLPWMVNKLVPQFEQMAPGSRIVAHEFWIDRVVPDQIVEIPVEGRDKVCIYLYTIPLRHDPSMELGKPPRIENVVAASAAVEP
jgi:SAM-dependent methyltransferase